MNEHASLDRPETPHGNGEARTRKNGQKVLGVGNKVINKTCKRVQGTKKRKSQARIWRKEKGTSDRVRDRTEPMSGQPKKTKRKEERWPPVHEQKKHFVERSLVSEFSNCPDVGLDPVRSFFLSHT